MDSQEKGYRAPGGRRFRRQMQVVAVLTLQGVGNEEGLGLQGKEKGGERERFAWGKETGMFMGMSPDSELMKLPEKGQQGGHPLRRWGE